MTSTLHRALAAGAVCGLALAGCQKPAGDAAAVRKQLREDEAQLNSDYKTRNVGAIASHYSADATVMTPGYAPAVGTSGIEAALKRLLADPAHDLQFAAEKVGVAQSGEIAYARGPYRLTLTNPLTHQPFTQTGSYVSIYRRQSDGGWKVIETIATVGDGVFTPMPPH